MRKKARAAVNPMKTSENGNLEGNEYRFLSKIIRPKERSHGFSFFSYFATASGIATTLALLVGAAAGILRQALDNATNGHLRERLWGEIFAMYNRKTSVTKRNRVDYTIYSDIQFISLY